MRWGLSAVFFVAACRGAPPARAAGPALLVETEPAFCPPGTTERSREYHEPMRGNRTGSLRYCVDAKGERDGPYVEESPPGKFTQGRYDHGMRADEDLRASSPKRAEVQGTPPAPPDPAEKARRRRDCMRRIAQGKCCYCNQDPPPGTLICIDGERGDAVVMNCSAQDR